MDGPCHKPEAWIWSSLSQFRTWENLNYSFEDKGEIWQFVKVRGILLRILTYSKESSKKGISCEVSTTRILYVPNIYLMNFHLIHHTHSFLIKTKLLLFYSGIMADIGALAELWKTSISFCHVCPNVTAWKQLEVLHEIPYINIFENLSRKFKFR